MVKIGKKIKEAYEKYDNKKIYSLSEATEKIKLIASIVNFNSSIDIAIRLLVDPNKKNQMIRGIVKFPHRFGKYKKILALVGQDKKDEAIKAGCDYIGTEYIDKIYNGWTDIDVIITTPMMMPTVGRLGKILGPKGLMPNPNNGTVTMDIGKTIQEIKHGKTNFKVDRYGIIHISIGNLHLSSNQIKDNILELIKVINILKPPFLKGTYIKSIYISGTMSPSIKIDHKNIQ
jgi:large subunit ribosomal protein L1